MKLVRFLKPEEKKMSRSRSRSPLRTSKNDETSQKAETENLSVTTPGTPTEKPTEKPIEIPNNTPTKPPTDTKSDSSTQKPSESTPNPPSESPSAPTDTSKPENFPEETSENPLKSALKSVPTATKPKPPPKPASKDMFSIRIGGQDELPQFVGVQPIDELKSIFSEFGEVGDVFLPKRRGETDHQGFGFVRFLTKEARKKCLKECDGSILICGIDVQVELCQAFVKGAVKTKIKGKSGFQGRKSCSMHHDEKNGARGIMIGHNGRSNTRRGGKAKKGASARCLLGSKQNGTKNRKTNS